jgi:hypothetical protein
MSNKALSMSRDIRRVKSPNRFVIPAQAGIQSNQFLDTGLRRCDGLNKTTP